MPELPEVETVRKQLEAEIMGAEIVGKGKIVEIARAGKYLFIIFAGGGGYAIHLKMTGRLVLDDPWYSSAKHTREIIDLRDGRKIYFWDVRKFGYIAYFENIDSEHQRIKDKLGPEPWDITDIDLLRKLQKTGRAVKEAILDQSLLAGVGNIYANDGLWKAGIDPRREARSLNYELCKKLRASLCHVLQRGLSTGGASDNSYVDAYGQRGSYQDEFLVYGRTGEPCNKCGMGLKRIVVGGRGTWLCEKCQR